MNLSFKHIRRIILLLLLCSIVVLRCIPDAGEAYSTALYPSVSYGLSFLASFIPYSLEEWIVIVALLIILLYPLISILFQRRFLRMIKGELETIGWVIVWFYIGWGCNYFRHDFYERLMIEPVTVSESSFSDFVKEYTDSLNNSYITLNQIDKEQVLEEIKNIYATVPSGYGLTLPQTFQHPKEVVFNDLYSSVGVLGYMGPFMSESQLNQALLPSQYPFTLAHETAHLLGVSSEAEANFWAYCVCIHSGIPAIRYSGYLGLLPYVANNARQIWDEKTVEGWMKTINPSVLSEIRAQSTYWQSLENPAVNKIQETLYNWFLKSNKIEEGMQNYSEVMGMVMAIRESHEEPLRVQGRGLSVKQ